jgi:hypothetical protein
MLSFIAITTVAGLVAGFGIYTAIVAFADLTASKRNAGRK